MKVAYTSEYCAQRREDFSDVPVGRYEFYGGQQKSVSAHELNLNINFQQEA